MSASFVSCSLLSYDLVRALVGPLYLCGRLVFVSGFFCLLRDLWV